MPKLLRRRYTEEELQSCACGSQDCKICKARYMRNWSSKHRVEIAERGKEYRDRVGPEAQLKRHQDYMARDPKKRWGDHAKVAANYRRALRLEVIAAYGDECACCRVREEVFLSIDHIDQKGAEHREKELGGRQGGSYIFYLWLKRHDFPKDNFRCLCRNCQYAYFKTGTCPHQTARARLEH